MSTTESTLPRTQPAEEIPASVPAEQPKAARPAPKTWLFGPWLDLLFVANVGWPLLVAAILVWQLPIMGAADPNSHAVAPLSFFQIYFISSPHRWITLVLVFLDPDRFRQEPRKFVAYGSGLMLLGLGLAALGALGIGTVSASSLGMSNALNTLGLFMMLDYVWNAWHFAAQHAGISAIYRRVGQIEKSPKQVEFEMSAIRLMVLWVFLRYGVYTAVVGKPQLGFEQLLPYLRWVDFAIAIPAAIVLYHELRDFNRKRIGRAAYVISMLSLYFAQMAAIQLGRHDLIPGLFFAQAIFHATEYLAVVNWSVQSRRSGVWKYQLARGGIGMAVFIGIIGVGNWAINHNSAYAWALITLLVSLLHYSYDGMIWKSKRNKKPAPSTATS
jgi:hypothetical protein